MFHLGLSAESGSSFSRDFGFCRAWEALQRSHGDEDWVEQRPWTQDCLVFGAGMAHKTYLFCHTTTDPKPASWRLHGCLCFSKGPLEVARVSCQSRHLAVAHLGCVRPFAWCLLNCVILGSDDDLGSTSSTTEVAIPDRPALDCFFQASQILKPGCAKVSKGYIKHSSDIRTLLVCVGCDSSGLLFHFLGAGCPPSCSTYRNMLLENHMIKLLSSSCLGLLVAGTKL